MHDSIFHESMRQEISFLLCRVILLVFLRIKEMDLFYRYNISGHGEMLSYNGHRQMELISLQ